MNGDWKGTEKTKLEELDFDVMSEDDDPTDVDWHEPGTGEPGRENAEPPEPVEVAEANHKVLRAMRQLETSFYPDASDFVSRHAASGSQQAGREEGQAAFEFKDWGTYSNFDTLACLSMLDRLQLGPEELALAALKVPDPAHLKPEQYKDVFTTPTTFREAWDHPDAFQKKYWRQAIKKEFSKMAERQVWRKVRRSDIPSNRRLIKCMWVFDI
jgi:hypothetical protein